MFIAVARDRDLSLNLTLESEARTILIAIGIALGVLLLATVVILQAHRFRKLRRYIFGFPSPISNQTEGEVPMKTTRSEPILTTRPIPHPRPRPKQGPSQARRITAFFASIRKNIPFPSRPGALYQGANGLYSPSDINHIPSTPASDNFVSPHIAGWMKVADSVVGQHPNAQPLSSRVATQTAINMISEGHIHIPWAFNDWGGEQPISVKVQTPVAVVHPEEPLKNVRNLRAHGRAILSTVSHVAKGKAIRQPLGKEDVLPAPPFFASHSTV